MCRTLGRAAAAPHEPPAPTTSPRSGAWSTKQRRQAQTAAGRHRLRRRIRLALRLALSRHKRVPTREGERSSREGLLEVALVTRILRRSSYPLPVPLASRGGSLGHRVEPRPAGDKDRDGKLWSRRAANSVASRVVCPPRQARRDAAPVATPHVPPALRAPRLEPKQASVSTHHGDQTNLHRGP